MAKTLEMTFLNTDGKPTKVSIENPTEPVDQVAVAQAMDQIIASDVFFTAGGDLVEKRGARVVERNVEEVTLG